jgi:hypothetical protein
VVEPAGREDRKLADHDERDRVAQQLVVADGDRGVEAQDEREQVRQRDQAGVDQRLRETAREHR